VPFPAIISSLNNRSSQYPVGAEWLCRCLEASGGLRSVLVSTDRLMKCLERYLPFRGLRAA